MLEFFDGGRRWTCGQMQDHDGNRCLVGALQYARNVSRARADGTAELLYSLVPAHQRRFGARPRSLLLLRLLMYFNDMCKDYEDVRRLMVRARETAQAARDCEDKQWPPIEPIDPDVAARDDSRSQEAKARKRRLLAEIELEKVARAAAGDLRSTYILCPQPPSNYRVSKVITSAGDTPKNQSNRERVLETLEG